MKNINKILSILITIMLVFTPGYVFAEEENNNQQTQTPTEGETETPETTPTPSESPEPTPPSETKEYSISLEKSEVEVKKGKTATLKPTVSPSDATIIWSSSDEEIATVDENGKVTAIKKGTAKITASIEGTDKEATCTVDVVLNNDASLKSLTIENGKLDQKFDSNTTKYNITIDKDENKLDFTDLDKDLNDSNAGWQLVKNSGLKNGSVVKIIVTAEDEETKKTYELTIVKETTSLNLKDLEINGYALNEVFDKDKTTYTASIPYEIETITVNAPKESDNAKVTTKGLTNLKVGTNTVTVTVSDEDGNSKVYKIIVTREKEVSVDEKPTSIITSSMNNTSSITQTPNSNNNDNGSGDNFLKYAIVSLACLILFTIGGIGIYFYIKTSPKKLKKQLETKKDVEQESSPIIEVENETQNQGNIQDIMDEKLVETREYKMEDLEEVIKPENLFDEDEDV